MKKIAIISDTHNFFDNRMQSIIKSCDVIWHAGDFGYSNQIAHLISNYNIYGVYGNIDGPEIRKRYPKIQKFKCEKTKILMTHIGGYPKKYKKEIKLEIQSYKPDIFICGHSHILKVLYDKDYNLLHINPGAAGREGFHQVRTMVLLKIDENNIFDLEVIELGKRSRSSNPIN